MIVGDLVATVQEAYPAVETAFGIVVRIDDSHRQTVADVLWSTGIEKNIWVNHLTLVEKRDR